MRRLIVTAMFLVCGGAVAKAQLIDFLSLGRDSTCITDRSDRLLVRVFTMQKFNKFTLGQYGFNENVTYRANNNYHVGLGFHYKWIGANVSFKLPYFNNKDYGRTRFFDLQSYLYLSMLAIDLYALSYRGYYLSDDDILKKPPKNGPYLREDLHTQNYGVNIQYIFNYRRFSYQAAFIQNQCQVRSAGSPIAGVNIHYTRAKADSAIIPQPLVYDGFYGRHPFNKSATFSLAVNGGYAYTYVFLQHFFVTASALAGVGANYVALKTDATHDRDARLHSQLHLLVRGAAGYNTDVDFIGLQYTNFVSRNNTPVQDSWQQLQAGNVRLTYARRFKLKKKTVKTLQDIEDKILPEIDYINK